VLEHKKNSLPLPLPKKTSWWVAKCDPLPGSDMRLLRLTYGIMAGARRPPAYDVVCALKSVKCVPLLVPA